MKTINALEIRNHLGAVLDDLEKSQEPIFVSKGRKVRAVLITPENFKARFLDRQAEVERVRVMEKIRSLRGKKTVDRASIDVLRALRGNGDRGTSSTHP